MINLIMSILVTAAPPPVGNVPEKVPAPPPVASVAGQVPPEKAVQDGIWPSERLARSLLMRWADRISDKFELDAAERDKVRTATVDRWSHYLKENRAELQPLLNEFLEMRLGLDAPSQEEVRRWADRALPALERLEEQAREATSEFREMVPPDKSAQFEAEAVKLGLGLQAAAQKLKLWKEGQYEPHEVWQAPRGKRRGADHRRETEKAAGRIAGDKEATRESQRASPADSDDQITLELTRWDAYVSDVIKRYEYDKAQKSAAISFLSELKGRAVAHRDRYKSEIAKLEQRIQHNSGADDEIAGIKADLITLYGPIDDLFRELKSRVESLATTQQRIRAAEKKERKEPRPNAPDTD